uniref:Reelin domain-containing protein n=1 Tax=Syphacia muris TaxID=451379 RepID=A0A0N5AS74_9BILA
MYFMQKFVLVLLLKALSIICDIVDFTITDPACDRLIPTYNANRVMAFASTKFRIRTHSANGSETFEYGHQPIRAVNKRHLQISVSVEGAPYTRVLIQARAVLAPIQQVGSFGEPMSDYFKIVTCSGQPATAAIIDRNVTRRHDGVTWNPPNFPTGPIVFFASPIEVAPNKILYPTRSHFLLPENHKPKDIDLDIRPSIIRCNLTAIALLLFTDITRTLVVQAVTIYKHRCLSNYIPVDAINCGRSHSCLSIGDDNCVFGVNCNISVKWICYHDRILIEAQHYGRVGAFGFAQNGEYSVMCLSTNDSISLENYGLQSGRLVSAYRRPLDQSYHKLLKALPQNDKFFCRYEMNVKDASNLFVYGSVNLQYAIPDHYKFEELETQDLCKPNNFHAVFQKPAGSTLTSQLMFAGGSHLSNAHLFIIFLIVHIFM